MLWSVQNHVHLWRWDLNRGWNPSPVTYKILLEFYNYPLHLWHPQYFHLLVASFGYPLYVDKANITGPDCSTLKMAVCCTDPSQVPWSITINYNDQCRECTVGLLGWSFVDHTNDDDYHGPTTGGRQTEVDWGHGSRSFNPQDNATNRTSLNYAHMTWLTA